MVWEYCVSNQEADLVPLNIYFSGLKSVLLGDTYVYKNIIQVFIQQTFY